MATTTLTQFSFNRGELDPALHGRSDWKYYSSGAEELRNLITRPQGGATKRGGLRLVAAALSDATPSYLIPFRFSVQQSYMLEFGDRALRIIKDGGLVVYPEDHERAGEVVVVESPYPVEAVPELRHAQTADVMIFTHPDFPPRRLARHDHHDWRFDNLITTDRTATPQNLRLVVSGGDDARYVVTAWSAAAGESTPSDPVTAVNAAAIEEPDGELPFSELYWWLYERDYSYMPADLTFHYKGPYELIDFLKDCGYRDYFGGIQIDEKGNRWQFARPDGTYNITIWWTNGDYSGLVEECLYACDNGWAGNVKPSLVSQIAVYVRAYNAGLAKTRISELVWDAVEAAEIYRIYRLNSTSGLGAYCLIGETSETAFTDENLSQQPTGLPEETEYFLGVDDYPGVCAFFEQRLILGRTNNQPTTFWGSDTGLYNSFTRHTPIEDTDCYEFTLASGEMNELHWIVPLNELLLGTSGGEWKAGGNGGAITPSNINARVQSWYGCSALEPVVAGRTVVFAGRSRRTIRSFSYSLEADGYSGRDLTAYAGHLFVGRTIVSLCHQQDPSDLLWAVMSDGALLSCTFMPEEEVMSWSRHETAGRFESIGALVGMDGCDQIYFCVAREVGGVTRRFIEVMDPAADAVTAPEPGFFLDCGLTYEGAAVGSVSGMDHLDGMLVDCLADGNVFTDLPVQDGRVTLPDGFTAGTIHVGLPYTAALTTLELEPEDGDSLRHRARFAVSAGIRFLASRECRYGHSGGSLSEMRFRTAELPGRPIALFSGEKTIVFTTPPGCRTTRLRFVSDSPVPFTILGIIAEASYGQPA
ncbi:MAG: hypothetical protein LIP77_09200 [Planctomycetes bacterium]|nr:hypothetical protein [Planctomycetota bacterium]